MSDPTPAQLLGRRVRAARTARGWSLLQLAERVGVSTTPVLRLEHGRPVVFSTAAAVAAVLGIPLDEPEARDD